MSNEENVIRWIIGLSMWVLLGALLYGIVFRDLHLGG